MYIISFRVVTPFQDIVALYPATVDVFRQNRDQLTKISDFEFRKIKDRLCLSVEFASRAKSLDTRLRSAILEAASVNGFQAAKAVVEPPAKDITASTSDIPFWRPRSSDRSFSSPVLRILNEAHDKARNIPDSRFFLEVINLEGIRKSNKLIPSIQDAKRLTQLYLASAIPRTVKQMVELAKMVQEDACAAIINAENTSYENEELRKLRSQLIRHVNDASARGQQV